MLLDIWSVLAGVGLAAVAFIVVILVCVVILRLLAAILPPYEDPGAPEPEPEEPTPDDATVAADAEGASVTKPATPQTSEQAPG